MSNAPAFGVLERELSALRDGVRTLGTRRTISPGDPAWRAVEHHLELAAEAVRSLAEGRGPSSLREDVDPGQLDAEGVETLFEMVEQTLDRTAVTAERMVAEGRAWQLAVAERHERIDRMQRETAAKLDAVLNG